MDNELMQIDIKILKSFYFKSVDLSKQNYSAELIARDTKLSLQIVKSRIEVLLEKNMIKQDPFSETTTYFRLTDYGDSFLSNEKELFKKKILWSVVIPLVVAVLGTVLTNLVLP